MKNAISVQLSATPPARNVFTEQVALDLFKDKFDQYLSVDEAMKTAKVGNSLNDISVSNIFFAIIDWQKLNWNYYQFF